MCRPFITVAILRFTAFAADIFNAFDDIPRIIKAIGYGVANLNFMTFYTHTHRESLDRRHKITFGIAVYHQAIA